MEADWEVEVGGKARVIEAQWAGFVDLRAAPEDARRLMEAGQLPALAPALARLNAAGSPVWTSKCDVWPLDGFDPDELDAPRETALRGMGCYIDLLPGREGQWPTADAAAAWCQRLCARLREIALRGCRVDCVVRGAHIDGEELVYGVTAYLGAAGPDAAAASDVLSAALAAFADSVAGIQPPAAAASKLQ